MKFDSFDMPALVDTGSEVSILDFNSFCKLQTRPKLQPAPFSIKSASNNRIPIRGMAQLMITVEGKNMLRPFCILTSPEKKCIIGSDTLVAEGLSIHQPQGQLKCNFEPIRSVEEATLEPFSEKMMSVRAPIEDGLAIVKSGPDALFNDGLVKFEKGLGRIVIQNPRPFPINCSRNVVIGKISRIAESQVLPDKEWHEVQAVRSKTSLNPKVKQTLMEELDLSKLPADLRPKYRDLVLQNADVFSINPNDIGRCSAVTQTIKLKDPSKVACIPPYRTPHHLLPVVDDYVKKLLGTGVIQKSNSPFSSPLLLVKKANAKPTQPIVEQYRVVHDYRQLNANTVKDSYPMHNLYDLIDRVSQAKVWSVIDLSSGFWNQELDPKSREYTAFGVPGVGHFEYTRSAQGLSNSPPSFQRLLDFITRDMPDVHVYVDDVVVCSNSHEEHQELLKKVFQKFREFNLKCRLKKVQLGTTEINYLGYNLSKAKGIRPGLAKTHAVQAWKPPQTVKEIKQFLGLCSFFRRTIDHFATIASPLTKLTRKDSEWKGGHLPENARQAFVKLQQKLCQRPCLAPTNFSREFILTTDASNVGLGAVLSQVDQFGIERPCAYASRTLNDTERKRAPFHLEYLAMVWACKHFKPYLAGKHFVLRTDHKPLEALNKTQGATFERLQMELEEFQPYTVKYLRGEKMPADGLSRMTEGVSINLNVNDAQLKDLQQQDVQAKAVFCYLKFGGLPRSQKLADFVNEHAKRFTLKNGLIGLMVKDHFIPYAPRSIRDSIMRLAHDDLTAGHSSAERTLLRIENNWIWPYYKEDVDIYCRSCHICNTVNLPHHKRPLPLEPFAPVSMFNERVHVDLLGPLPVSEGNRILLVIIDAFSKYVEFVPLPSKEMEIVSNALFDHWICRHGSPLQLHSDLGKEFANSLFTHLAKRFSFDQTFSSVSHPQSNGQAERQIRTTINYLRKYLNGTNDWTKYLPSLACAHNTSVHSSTKYTPFMAAFSRLPRLPLSFGSSRTYSDSELDQRLALAAKIKFDIVKNQQNAFENQKTQFDKRARQKDIQLGDVVFVERSKRGQQFQKFQPLYEGPYRVTKWGNHQNIYIEPLNPGKQVRKAMYVHPNLVKLAPFAKQITSFPAEDEQPDAPNVRRRQQYQPKEPPLQLDSTFDDDLPVGAPTLPPSSPVTTHTPTQNNEDEEVNGQVLPSPMSTTAEAVPEEEPETGPAEEETINDLPTDPALPAGPIPPPVPSPQRAPPPTPRHESPLRRVLRSIGARLPDSILGDYPKERKKRKKAGEKEEPRVSERGRARKKILPSLPE